MRYSAGFLRWRLLLQLALSASTAAVEDGAVRLSGGNTDAGRVEVYYAGHWGAICLDDGFSSWSKKEADVVCRQLGLRRGVAAMRMANIADVSPLIGAVCNGTETRLGDCSLQKSTTAVPGCADSSQPATQAGVRCTNFVAEEQPQVLISHGSHGDAELRVLLEDSSHSLRCNPTPSWVADGVSQSAQPRFTCTVDKLNTDAQQTNSSAETCSSAADSSCRGGLLRGSTDPFETSSLRAYVFQPEMNATLAVSRLQAVDASNVLHDESLREAQSLAFSNGETRLAPVGLKLQAMVGAPDEGLESRITALKSLYLSPLGRIFLDLDAQVLGLRGPKPSRVAGSMLGDDAAGIARALEQDGVVRVQGLGLDLKALRAAALEALAVQDPRVTSSTNGGVVASRAQLPPLEKWLREDSRVPSAIAGYLGGHATLHGYKAVHLPATLSTDAYVSAHWHHDRAGRRVKLFILLHDVDPDDGHPTQVAKGSHDLVYYWHEEFHHSRYRDDFVRSEFEVEKLAGKAGDAYIFDTNAIHKGTPEGSHSRDVVIVEFHHAAKCGIIDRLGLNVPCPSGDQRPLNWFVDLHGVNSSAS